MSGWELYWLVKLDDISSFFGVTTLIFLIGLVIMFVVNLIARAECDDPFKYKSLYGEKDRDAVPERKKNCAKRFKTLIFLSAIPISTMIACTLIPTTKQMAVIMVAPKIINNQKMQEMPQKVLDVADEWLNELKPKKEGK